MTQNFQMADWAIVAFTIVAAVTGLFRGFSGTLAFLLACAAGVVASSLGWGFSETFADAVWMRVAGTLVFTLLVFGLVRYIVRKVVNGLLAQPADAIFGFISGAAFGLMTVIICAVFGVFEEYSYLVGEAMKYVR